MRLKRFFSLVLCMALLCGLCVPASAAQKQTITVDPINIMVGGKVFLPTDVNGENVPVFVYEGTTYAPLRALAEAYDLTVGYDQTKNIATVDGTPSADFAGTKGTAQALTTRTTLSVSPINIEVGGVVFQPKDVTGKDVPVFVYNGTTYAPLRALAEAYGLTVGYDQEKNLATVDFVSTAATVLSAEKDAELHAELQARIDEILNTKTEIVHSDTFIPGKTYTGTAYYISNDGDDSNDGLTPETAWQTIGRLAQEAGGWGREGILKPGDAVFFRRGDIFRDQNFHLGTDGLTFSAYGEGVKPIFTSSSENGSGAEKWELVYENDTGIKIWQYYRDMTDVSRIVLNNGEAITTRVYEYYDGNGYISCEATGWWMQDAEGVTLLNELLPLEESMTEDLTIISRPDKTKDEFYYCGSGPLYLRCDGGNPGDLFDSIEFSEYVHGSNIYLCASNCVFDNISFRCNGVWYIAPNKWKEIKNTLVQNCEFAYGGGQASFYHVREDGAVVVEVQGDGIYNIVRNTTIQNNYFHDGTMTGVTYEGDNFEDTDTVDGYYHFLNNICVNTMGIRLDSTAVALQYLDSVKVCGNQVWNTGHMDQGKLIYSEGSLHMMPNHYGECVIEDNVFYGTENGHPMNALLNMYLYDFDGAGYARPRLGNNTYVQYADRDFAYFYVQQNESWSMNDPELLTKVAELLGDTTSEFYVIK